MGGGPRTFPGGVTKWQWKRMLVKKREAAESRRLEREKRVFEMRARAEILSAHPELQQPWEKLAPLPPLHQGISVQQQISALSGRFLKPHAAEDLWDHKDGPQRILEDAAPQQSPVDRAGVLLAGQPVISSSSTSKFVRQDRGSSKKKKRKNVSSYIGKSTQDYLDSFETNPLGISTVMEKETDAKGRRRFHDLESHDEDDDDV